MVLRASRDIVREIDRPFSSRHPVDLQAAKRGSLPTSVRVTVVIPALNEEENLRLVLPRIPAWVHEVVLVDGNSTDRSVAVAREARPDVRIVSQRGSGKGNALRAGFAVATGEIIVTLDADGSTNPAEIPAFVGALLAGADFAKGSRFIQGGGTADMSLVRRLGNGLLSTCVTIAFNCSFSDLCYGYNAFWRWVLPFLNLDADGFEIETLMNVRALQAGLRVVEVHSFEDKRFSGESRLRPLPDGWRVLKTIIKERMAPGARHLRSNRQPPVTPWASRGDPTSAADRSARRRAG